MPNHLPLLLLHTIVISALNIPLPLPLPLHPFNLSIPTLLNTTTTTTTPTFGICSSLTTTPPLFTDCQTAIRHRLPSSPSKATFHTEGARDIFTLPIYEYWRSCNITIVLGGRGRRTEESSWEDVRDAAEEVNEVCRVGRGSGGKIMVGEGGGIWVKLSRVGVGGGGVREF